MMVTSDRWTCPRCQRTVAQPPHTARLTRDVERQMQALARDRHRCAR